MRILLLEIGTLFHLITYHCEETMFEVYQCHALDGELGYTIGYTSREIAINYGVPQGSPISPLFFLLYLSKPATCVASPHVQRIWEGVQTHFITRTLSIPCFIHNDRKRQHAYLPPIHDRNLYLAKHWYINLYLAKRWYRRAMLHNSGVQDYVDNHTHNERTHTSSRNTPLELIRN